MSSRSGRSSFKSYLPDMSSEVKKRKKLEAAYEKMYQRPTEEIEKSLMPGELITGIASKVIKYSHYDDPSRGPSGYLVCTNFRVMFVTTEQLQCDLNELNHRLLGKHDIPLSNIDSLYVEYPNKRKRLVPSSKVKDGIQRLEIHCKNFRVAAFSFKLTVKFEEQGVVKAILHHSYPSNANLLFAFDYRHDINSDTAYERSGVLPYRSHNDWLTLLKKHDAEESWRVTSLNKGFGTSPTMAEHFVVPKTMTDDALRKAAVQFNHSRIPMWCWCATNGCALLRSSEVRSDTEFGDVEKKKIHNEIKANGNNHPIKVIDVGKLNISHIQIQQSFNKLKNLCLITSMDEFYSSDSTWFVSLHASRWLQTVSAFLTLAVDALQYMIAENHHVIIKECSGFDVTPVLTSLIQLLADPSCRTLIGFQSLIQREWVVAGFPFLDRLGHLHQPTKSKANNLLTGDNDNAFWSPVFLLFLDCVWQLTQQYPSSFEFTSVFLIVLHDSSRFDVFDTFLFNNERERNRCIYSAERQNNGNFSVPPPVWDWSFQFDDQSRKLFINPFYRLAEMKLDIPPLPEHSLTSTMSLSASLDSLCIVEPPSPSSDGPPTSPANSEADDISGMQLHYDSKTGVLTSGMELTEEKKKKIPFSINIKLTRAKPQSSELSFKSKSSSSCVSSELQQSGNADKGDILTPHTSVANLDLWTFCYFRWSPWSQVYGGHPAVTYQRHSSLYDEIFEIHKKIIQVESQLDGVSEKRQSDVNNDDSGMYFRRPSDTSMSLDFASETPVPNFFPFLPVKSDCSKSILGSAFPNYHRSSSILGLRGRSKHARSSSDISVPTSYGEDQYSSSQSLDNLGEDRRRSVSAQPPKPPDQSAKPKKKVPLMPPSQSLPPPKERITYISSV